MSYCRFSSDSWRCDVYCYEDCSGGWTTHVAGRRVVGDVPLDDNSSIEAFFKTHQAQLKFLETAKHEDINLEHAGARFNDPDLESFKATLTMLKEKGYNIPAYVFESIDAEIEIIML